MNIQVDSFKTSDSHALYAYMYNYMEIERETLNFTLLSCYAEEWGE